MGVMVTITKELFKRWKILGLISDELLPMGVMNVFEAPISTLAKLLILLRKEILGQRGMVYVVARAARRVCTKTGWDHPGSIQALDLCDRVANGGAISKEELANAAKAAEAVVRVTTSDATWAAWAAWAAVWATFDVSSLAPVRTDALTAVAIAVRATSSKEEERAQLADCREWLMRVPVLTDNGSDLIANTKEIIPMGLMGLFEVPLPPEDKIEVLLHEEVLGRRGMVFVAARAAHRSCMRTGWSHPDSLRALDLCDRYVEGEEIPKEELENTVNVADVAALSACDAASDASWGAAWATCKAVRAANAASSLSPVRTDAWAAVETAAVRATSNEEGEKEEERKSQLADCREWLLRGNP